MKKLASIIIAVFMLVGIMPLGAVADDAVIEISTPEQLYNIRNDLTASYVLTQDIDISGYANWTPIGIEELDTWVSTTPFRGRLDGAGYKVTGLTITNTSGDERSAKGLFLELRDAEIRNLGVEDVNINMGDKTNICGGLAPVIVGSTITNCYVKGEIKSNGIVGGFAGSIFESTIINCYAEGSVIGAEVGGFASEISGETRDCYAIVDVKANRSNRSYIRVGGFAGSLRGSIINCYSVGDVEADLSTHCYVGGFVGSCSSGSFETAIRKGM